MEAMSGRLPETPEAWAFALAEACNAAAKAKAVADHNTFLAVVLAIQNQTRETVRESGNHFDGLKAAAIGYECHKDEGHNIALQEAVCHYNAVVSGELKLTDIEGEKL